MKSFVTLTAILAGASAVAIPADNLEKRQLGGMIAQFFGTAKQAVVLRKLQPEYRANATRAVYMYGPFRLPPSNATHLATGFSYGGIKLDPNSDTPGGVIEPPCKDCTVLKATANFAFKDGRQAGVGDGVYTHHIIIVDTGGKSQLGLPIMGPWCKNGAIITPIPPMGDMGKSKPKPAGGNTTGAAAPKGAMGGMSHTKSKRQTGFSVFIGGGGDVGSGHAFAARPGSEVNSGYWIGKGGGMHLTSEIVNYDPVAKDIYLTLDVEWVPGKDPNMMDVGLGALSSDRCDDKEKGMLYPPKDRAITYKGEDWTAIDTGYFINFAPHMHDGATNMKIWINDKEVCKVDVIYGDTAKAPDGKKWQTITGYTPCEKPIQIKKGDRVSMSAEYDLTKHRLRPDNNNVNEEAEAMALANYIWARPFSKGFWDW